MEASKSSHVSYSGPDYTGTRQAVTLSVVSFPFKCEERASWAAHKTTLGSGEVYQCP